jgi:hypothetical protein
MAIIAPKSGGNFTPASEGIHLGVLAEVRDLGMQQETYKGVEKTVPKILFRWQLDELDEKNEPKRIYEKFTLSDHEKARLTKRVISIYKKPAPADFDYEEMVGVQRNLVITQNVGKDGKTYANIDAILKLNEGQAKLEIVVIPKKDEVQKEVAAALKQSTARPVTAEDPIDSDDLPF